MNFLVIVKLGEGEGAHVPIICFEVHWCHLDDCIYIKELI